MSIRHRTAASRHPARRNAAPTVPPGVALALASSTLALTAGQTAGLALTVTRVGGFTGALAVNVSGLPAGVSAGLLVLAPGTTSAVLTLTATRTRWRR
jgi:hypothetical protein